MKRNLRTMALCLALLLWARGARGQNELIVSQYVHNYFAVNPSFAGSRGGLSLFAGARKQWAGITHSPTSLLLTAHTPMRHEKLTGGASVYHQQIGESANSGLMATVGYRTLVGRGVWLGLALQPGVALRSRDWSRVRTMEAQDEAFAERETGAAPLLGLGASLYGEKFFAGLSTTTLVVTDDFERRTTKFSPADATYVACGGYWLSLGGGDIALQPSAMADYSRATGAAVMGSISGVWRETAWLTAAYQTTRDLTLSAAYKPNSRLKVAYSYSMNLGPLSGYGSGSHELTLQYDLVWSVRVVGPRFY